MAKEWYINEITNCIDYERVYDLITEAQDDKHISDREFDEIYEIAKPILCKCK